MKLEQFKFTKLAGWDPKLQSKLGDVAQVVFVFGATSALKSYDYLHDLESTFPHALLVGCSTAGEICDTRVLDDSLVATAVHFEHTRIRLVHANVSRFADSERVGEHLAKSLPQDDLVHTLVFSDGLKINGSELVRGLTQHLPENVTVTGGLSADGERFRETLVLAGGPPAAGEIALLGFYGKRLQVGYGSLGGWDVFGPVRQITRSTGNVLYDMDGKSALETYKKYLGDYAKDLPASALLFPLSLLNEEGETGVVRTILSVNEQDQSMTFAGDVPLGAYGRFMKANFDRLIDGAQQAARTSNSALGKSSPDLAILISCVGRKMVLKGRIEEEVEGVRKVLGKRAVLTGFYSYGEISPFTPSARCELHNQTMTITTFSEK
ncbi:MAG TPA: FIST N-terminal domain-containing protein [bacterium]